MSIKEEIVVKDSCILFDLLDLDIMEKFYQLELVVYTTPQVIIEITDETQMSAVEKYINSGELIIDNYGIDGIIQAISDENPGLSFADSSVLELAIRKECTLLSSDGGLRRVSTKRNITVRGLLWIIEELYNKQFITLEEAIDRLNKYPEVNRRAPRKEIEELLQKLNNT